MAHPGARVAVARASLVAGDLEQAVGAVDWPFICPSVPSNALGLEPGRVGVHRVGTERGGRARLHRGPGHTQGPARGTEPHTTFFFVASRLRLALTCYLMSFEVMTN